MTTTWNSPGYPTELNVSSFDKYYVSLTIIYFSARWLVRADLQNRGTHHVPTEVESEFRILKKTRDNPA